PRKKTSVAGGIMRFIKTGSWKTLLGLAAAVPLLAWGAHAATAANNKIKPGEFVIDHPTLMNLGFEWVVNGDDNRNAQVKVAYRKVGDKAWKDGMPLLRLRGERIYQKDSWDMESPNMFAGSILDLEPGTKYEARFTMTDPDGVSGAAVK